MIAAMATTRRADMFTADGKPSDDDPRENGPTLGDERTTLVEALRCQRLTLEMKCSGLDVEAMARRSVEPSTMSLLGLVRHLAEIERGTFREMMAGQDVPRLFCSDTDRDGDFDGAGRNDPGVRPPHGSRGPVARADRRTHRPVTPRPDSRPDVRRTGVGRDVRCLYSLRTCPCLAVRGQPEGAAGCAGVPCHHNRTGNPPWMPPIAVSLPAGRSMATCVALPPRPGRRPAPWRRSTTPWPWCSSRASATRSRWKRPRWAAAGISRRSGS